MLRDAVLDERRVEPGDGLVLLGTGMHPVLKQEGRQLRQGAQVVMGIDGVVERIAQQGPEIVREAVGIYPLALDQARIAEGGFFARLALVDEKDGPAPLL
jgi:2-phosphoglycerate kinase